MNIFIGKLNTVYEIPMNNEIAALTIDKNIKELEFHNVEINMLAYSLVLNIVVSCSIDNIINIH